MPKNVEPPRKSELEEALGSALPLWNGIFRLVEGTCAPLNETWRPSKSEFGRMCLLQHKKRTLLYITPDKEKVWVAVVLGERAYQLALASALPGMIKNLFQDAKPYVEGRGIRFPISSLDEIPTVAQLLKIKTTPA